MDELTNDTIDINDVKVKTRTRFCKLKNTNLAVEAGCTGLRGDVPRERSSRAFLVLDGLKGDFFFNPVEDEDDKVVGFGVCCCGDEAVMALLEALTFATIEIAERCLTREEKEAPMKLDWPVTD